MWTIGISCHFKEDLQIIPVYCSQICLSRHFKPPSEKSRGEAPIPSLDGKHFSIKKEKGWFKTSWPLYWALVHSLRDVAVAQFGISGELAEVVIIIYYKLLRWRSCARREWTGVDLSRFEPLRILGIFQMVSEQKWWNRTWDMIKTGIDRSRQEDSWNLTFGF